MITRRATCSRRSFVRKCGWHADVQQCRSPPRDCAARSARPPDDGNRQPISRAGATPGKAKRAGICVACGGGVGAIACDRCEGYGSAHHRKLSSPLPAVIKFQPEPRVEKTPALSQIFEPIRGDLELVDREFVRHVESQVAVIPQIGRYIQTSGG